MQAALGAVVVLATSTMNRVMVVELALPALLPGALVALHYAGADAAAALGHGSDVGGRRTPWIVGGMAVLALAVPLAPAVGDALMRRSRVPGIVAGGDRLPLIGIGVGCLRHVAAGAAGAARRRRRRRAAAATVLAHDDRRLRGDRRRRRACARSVLAGAGSCGHRVVAAPARFV